MASARFETTRLCLFFLAYPALPFPGRGQETGRRRTNRSHNSCAMSLFVSAQRERARLRPTPKVMAGRNSPQVARKDGTAYGMDGRGVIVVCSRGPSESNEKTIIPEHGCAGIAAPWGLTSGLLLRSRWGGGFRSSGASLNGRLWDGRQGGGRAD